MYRMLEDDVFHDLESIIRNTMRTQSLWDEAHEDADIDDDEGEGDAMPAALSM